MADLLSIAQTGITHPLVYRTRDSDGAFWHVGDAAWEAWDAAHVGSYSIASPEIPGTGNYLAVDPTDGAAGLYFLVNAAGTSLTVSDLATRIVFYERVYGSSGLDAAGVRAAIGLAAPNLDAQLANLDSELDTIITALSSADVTFVSPVQPLTNTVQFYRGSSYTVSNGRKVQIAIPPTVQDLTGVLRVEMRWQGVTLIGTVGDAGLSTQYVRFEANAGVTGSWDVTDSPFYLWAVYADDDLNMLDVIGRVNVIATI